MKTKTRKVNPDPERILKKIKLELLKQSYKSNYAELEKKTLDDYYQKQSKVKEEISSYKDNLRIW